MTYVKLPTADGHDCFINTKIIAAIETHIDDPGQCAIGFLGGFQILSVPLSGKEVVSIIERVERGGIKMAYNSEVKRDCIFYEEYQDMGARADFCNFKGHSWDNTEAAVCHNCKKYIPSETVRAIFRHLLEEAKEEKT